MPQTEKPINWNKILDDVEQEAQAGINQAKGVFSGWWKDFGPVVLRNTISPTTILIAVLTTVLLIIGQHGDALFLASTITINAILAIVQEIRARNALDKLSILNSLTARRLTKKGIITVPLNDITPGDIIFTSQGDQIGVDGIIANTEGLQVDESLLTGESRGVYKNTGDKVFAGSLVLAGNANIRVTAGSTQTVVALMTEKLRWYDQKLTPLQQSLYQMIQWFTYLAIFVSLLIFLDQHGSNLPMVDIINTIVAGALSLVPEGLLLASTVLFSYGAIMMSSKGVLVQRLAAIEGFGRLEYLCIDKTGTITDTSPILEEIIPLGNYDANQISLFLLAMVQAEPVPNPTLRAIATQIPTGELKIVERVPFSPVNKWSAVRFKDGEVRRCIALGAPEILAKSANLSQQQLDQAKALMANGLRVLLLADYGNNNLAIEQLNGRPHGYPVAFLALSSRLRPGAIDSIFYLQAQGVQIKVISGDSAETTQHIAREAGVRNVENVLTGDELALLDKASWDKLVPKTTIFARVLPEQKEKLIITFKKLGFTGMAGDGINDALALKVADLGVAMASGSQASRQVADVILLNNNLTAFPDGMRLGSRIILGLEMVACLFMNKIVFSLILIFISMLLNTPYPFQARYLLLLNLFTIGLPTALWSLIPAETGHRLDPKHFYKRILHFSLFNGAITGLAIMIGFSMARWQVFGLSVSANPVQTPRLVATLIAISLGVYAFLLIPRSLGAIQSQLQKNIQNAYLVICPLLLFGFSRIGWISNYLQLTRLTFIQWLTIVVVVYLAGKVQMEAVRKDDAQKT